MNAPLGGGEAAHRLKRSPVVGDETTKLSFPDRKRKKKFLHYLTSRVPRAFQLRCYSFTLMKLRYLIAH